MVVVLLGASVLLFACLFVAPGDPLTAMEGGNRVLDAETRASLIDRYRLNQSLPRQYVHYLSRLVRADLGESYRQRRSVNDVVREKAGNTGRLAVAALACQAFLGVAAGVVAAVSRRRFLDVLVVMTTGVAIGLPVFVIGLVLQQAFALRLGWLPLQGHGAGARSIVLPALTLGVGHAALVARLTRATLLDVLGADYIRTATAKGVPWPSVVLRHGLRTSVIPVVAYLGVAFGGLLGGAAVVETIFNWDGLGRALVTAVTAQDNPVVLGVVVYGVAAFVVVNLVVDLVSAVLDPRIRLDA
jgi:oligopeptide transport system permease protein